MITLTLSNNQISKIKNKNVHFLVCVATGDQGDVRNPVLPLATLLKFTIHAASGAMDKDTPFAVELVIAG